MSGLYSSRPRYWIIFILAVFGLGAPASAKTYAGVSYGPALIDVHAPAGAASAPVIVFVHGGAWASRSRSWIGQKARFFNDLGYVFASIDHTLYPIANVGKQADEVAAAINWLSANAASYGGDPTRIGLIGHSSGAHLGALAVLSKRTRHVAALALIDSGAFDLPYLAKINGGFLPILYALPFADRNRWHEWSPVSYAPNGSHPPTLIAWSGTPNQKRISKRFAHTLRQYGTKVVLFAGPAYSHDGINNRIASAGDPISEAVKRFLSTHLPVR